MWKEYLNLFHQPEEEQQFEIFYKTHFCMMLHIAKNILRDPYTAEDVVQQAFLNMAAHFDVVQSLDEKKQKSYVVRVIRNLSIDVYRKRQRCQAYFLLETACEGIADDPCDQWLNTLDNPTKEAIEKLPKKYRDVLVSKYYYGYSEQELAEKLLISIGNVRTRLYRAKLLLQDLLKKN